MHLYLIYILKYNSHKNIFVYNRCFCEMEKYGQTAQKVCIQKIHNAFEKLISTISSIVDKLPKVFGTVLYMIYRYVILHSIKKFSLRKYITQLIHQDGFHAPNLQFRSRIVVYSMCGYTAYIFFIFSKSTVYSLFLKKAIVLYTLGYTLCLEHNFLPTTSLFRSTYQVAGQLDFPFLTAGWVWIDLIFQSNIQNIFFRLKTFMYIQ